MSLRNFRRLRVPVIRGLIPVMVVAWLGAAAAPCAAMTGSKGFSHHAMGEHGHAGSARPLQQDPAPEGSTGDPSCPHCASAPGCHNSGDAAARVCCSAAAAVPTAADRSAAAKRDSGVALVAIDLLGAWLSRTGPSRIAALANPIEPPSPARHLRFCVYLN